MNHQKWSSNLLSLYLPNCLLFRSLHSLFHLVSIHFHFGTPPPAKKNNFWCSHQMSHYLRWVILRWSYQNESFYYAFFTWTCLVGAVPFLFLLFGRVELESDAATETGDSETLFWASLISSPISSVVEASVWTFRFYFEKKQRNIFKNGSGPKWTVQHDRPNWSPGLAVPTWTTNLTEPIWTATLTVQFDRPVWPYQIERSLWRSNLTVQIGTTTLTVQFDRPVWPLLSLGHCSERCIYSGIFP